jgi:hypothetical protein
MPDAATMTTILPVLLIVAAGSAGQAAIGMGLNLFAIPMLVLIDPCMLQVRCWRPRCCSQ